MQSTLMSTPPKKEKGQFYTTHASYILEGMSLPDHCRCVEPFAGKGDLLSWIQQNGCSLVAYDIDPKHPSVVQRDTLVNPPDYTDQWIITNPPYLARNKTENKKMFDLYQTNDLYKCFIYSVVQQNRHSGGIWILPAGFFFSHRDVDVRCRNEFMKHNRILRVNYFEETVFEDTSTTVVAISFVRAPLMEEQTVEWVRFPSKESKVFTMSSSKEWIIGGHVYTLPTSTVKLRRHVEGSPLKENEQQTYLTLNALDSGTTTGRISLTFKPGYIYPAKDSSRTYATLRILGRHLTEEEQQKLSVRFNTFLEEKRTETWGLFLPQYRESKEYARKRIPFELAYRIISHLLL